MIARYEVMLLWNNSRSVNCPECGKEIRDVWGQWGKESPWDTEYKPYKDKYWTKECEPCPDIDPNIDVEPCTDFEPVARPKKKKKKRKKSKPKPTKAPEMLRRIIIP